MGIKKDEFIDSILPGNYWITKSMEFRKVNTSGTLWYLKKWFVYYNYIFMKSLDSITQESYNEIIQIFNDFIITLDDCVKKDAERFFFFIGENDIRNNNFTKFNEFSNTKKTFNTEIERREFIVNCKKFYFMYLMDIGGQAGDKAKIKHLIELGNSYDEIDIKMTEKLTKENKINSKAGLFSDYHAAIRNERQIFFYYGLFHGAEKSDLSGFYKMTNIGKSIIKANFHELLLIWEHQKLKMISQSPITEINNLNPVVGKDKDQFNICYSPYYRLIELINKVDGIEMEQYKYIISRINESHVTDEIVELLNDDNFIEEVKNHINTFKRKADKGDEDFAKEIKKYSLGISNLPKDKNTNYFGFLSKDGLNIINKHRGEIIEKYYKIFSEYLIKENSEIFTEFRNEIKRKYMKLYNSQSYSANEITVYKWNKYIINFDRVLLLNLIYLGVILKNNIIDSELNSEIISDAFQTYRFILNNILGIKTKKEFSKTIKNVEYALKNYSKEEGIYNHYKEDDELIKEEIGVEPIQNKISLEILSNTSKVVNEFGKRNSVLVDQLRYYYIQEFSDKDKLIKCDCCQKTTFLTKGDYAYLEFHHIIPFNQENGPDHYINLVGLCPQCHRKLHYAKINDKKDLYEGIAVNNNLKLNIENRVRQLLKEDRLEPIHLDFLKAEKAITKEFYYEIYNSEII